MLRPGVAERIAGFVKAGGTFVATYLTGCVNESDLCFLGGFPGPLRPVLGVWAEELDVPQQAALRWRGKKYAARQFCEVIHAESAEVLAEFVDGGPALTVNHYGKGRAYYVASRNEDRLLTDFSAMLARELKRSLEAMLPAGVTAQRRGRRVFVMNFNATPKTVRLKAGKTLKLAGYGCHVAENK
jgi:beta-galactosidase